MIVHEIPYEVIKELFGTFIAENFNTINLILAAIGLLFSITIGRKISFKIHNHQNNKIDITDEYNDQECQEQKESTLYESQQGKWSPTGWVYDRETQKWYPPDYLAEESHKKWKWNSEKQIWIDVEKEERLKRYHENRKAMGLKPTYEEWKAERNKVHPEK